MNYTDKIQESVEFLLEAERKRGSALDRDRARFLRLLRTGDCKSQATAGAAIGLCARHAQRLWQIYCREGFEGLMTKPSRRGFGKLTSQQISHLRQFLRDNQAQTLEHIQAYLSGSLGVQYTIGGVSELCKRLKIKRKSGRPVNVRQKPGAVELFKKTLPNSELILPMKPSSSTMN
jgi:transposase